MTVEQTFSIIKPDAVSKNHIGDILSCFEQGGLRIAAARMLVMTRQQVVSIYGIHEGKPFYSDLLQFMTSGPCIVMVLEGENAIARNREIMGNTNPDLAAPGTIRARFGTATNRNAVHGSDSPESARHEIGCFFTSDQICSQLTVESSERRYQSAWA
jgi:nucleoside-diphosphate kinase